MISEHPVELKIKSVLFLINKHTIIRKFKDSMALLLNEKQLQFCPRKIQYRLHTVYCTYDISKQIYMYNIIR